MINDYYMRVTDNGHTICFWTADKALGKNRKIGSISTTKGQVELDVCCFGSTKIDFCTTMLENIIKMRELTLANSSSIAPMLESIITFESLLDDFNRMVMVTEQLLAELKD